MNPNHKPVSVAVVGLGLMGVTYLKALQQLPEARLAGVTGKSRRPVNGVLPGASRNTGGADALVLGPEVQVYPSFEALLADPAVELVCLCVPTAWHVLYAVAALQAGKHVLCEKPLARDLAGARAIQAAARAARGYFMPAMCLRFWPGWAELKALATGAEHGPLWAARFRRVSALPAWGRENYLQGAASGGALLDLHIHDTDFVQYLFGRPRAVFSTGQSVFSGAIDHVVTQYLVAGGATVYAEGSWLQAGGFAMSYTLNFARATLDYDSRRGPDALQLTLPGESPCPVPLAPGDGYLGELRYLLDCIQTARPPSTVTVADGVQAVEICAAEETSVLTGQVIWL